MFIVGLYHGAFILSTRMTRKTRIIFCHDNEPFRIFQIINQRYQRHPRLRIYRIIPKKIKHRDARIRKKAPCPYSNTVAPLSHFTGNRSRCWDGKRKFPSFPDIAGSVSGIPRAHDARWILFSPGRPARCTHL